MIDDQRYACCPSHCCDQHGCKYGLSGCPVVKKRIKQQYPCETCGLTREGYYGEGNDLGYYDDALTWHPPDGSVEHDREVEDKLLARVAAFLRGRGLHAAASDVEAREFE